MSWQQPQSHLRAQAGKRKGGMANEGVPNIPEAAQNPPKGDSALGQTAAPSHFPREGKMSSSK